MTLSEPMQSPKQQLQLLEQRVQTELKTLQWALAAGEQEVEAIFRQLPNPLMELVDNRLMLTGRVSIQHWDDLDELFSALKLHLGPAYILDDDPEMRSRTFQFEGHPYFAVRIRIKVLQSEDLDVDAVAVPVREAFHHEFFWKDKKRARSIESGNSILDKHFGGVSKQSPEQRTNGGG